jgi:hypothetical protein
VLCLDTRRLTLFAAVCALLTAAPAAGAATRQVTPGGADSGNCLSSPCRSLAYAYGQSASGDVVRVGAGSYPSQTVPAGTKAVTFRGAAGARLRQLDSAASNVVFDSLEVDGAFTKALVFHSNGDNASFRNGRIGNVTDEKGALVSGTGFTFDNVVFHDVRATNPSIHNECIYAIGSPRLTVRNSLFHNCATMDLFFTYGSWWVPLPPAYGRVTLENNVFGHTYKDDGTWHYYSLYVANTANDGGTVDGWVVRNNTFEIPANIEHAATGGSRWVGNLGDWNCVSGMRYSHNVGQRCGGSDKPVSPAGSTAALPAAFGWVAPSGLNFRLRAGSPAIDAANPSDHPALDRDGYVRGNRPDAGAHEFGAGPPRPGTGPPGSPTSPGKRRLVKSARLRPHVICKHRRRGCARSARLSLSVTQRSRLAVRVVRRHGKRVRTLKLGLRKRPLLRIRARGLKRGRYRIVVVATGATGLKASARTFRLRVR